MAKRGYDVTVFEALHEIGGVLKYGIPEFRLPNRIVDFEIDNLRQMGVHFIKDCIVGKTVSVQQLEDEGFAGVFVASGAGLPNFMGIPGENLTGVMSSNEYLTRVNLMEAADQHSDTPVPHGKHGCNQVPQRSARPLADAAVDQRREKAQDEAALEDKAALPDAEDCGGVVGEVFRPEAAHIFGACAN